jgi:glutathione peroxidase
MADMSAWDFSFPSIEAGTVDLAAFKGRVLLVANTASFCGYTGQYDGLEKLQQAAASRGLTIVGVPSRDFNQESADNAAVKAFCDTKYGVRFPMTGISHVRGPQAAPFYAWVREQTRWEPNWNFNKVLIGRDGRVVGTFGSGDEPQGPKLSQAIEAELSKQPE